MVKAFSKAEELESALACLDCWVWVDTIVGDISRPQAEGLIAFLGDHLPHREAGVLEGLMLTP